MALPKKFEPRRREAVRSTLVSVPEEPAQWDREKYDRISNDVGYRIRLMTLAKWIENFRGVLERGMDEKVAAKYTIQEHEAAMWHSRTIDWPKKETYQNKGWYQSTTRETSVERFLSIIAHTVGQEIPINRLKGTEESWLLIMKFLDSSREKRIKTPLRNYRRIFGEEKTKEQNLWVEWSFLTCSQFLTWKKFPRARDLMVFGPFDVAKIIDELRVPSKKERLLADVLDQFDLALDQFDLATEDQQLRLVTRRGVTMLRVRALETAVSVFTPGDVIQRAYGADYHLIEILGIEKGRYGDRRHGPELVEYIKRYWPWFKDNMGRLDEFLEGPYELGQGVELVFNVRPELMLRRIFRLKTIERNRRERVEAENRRLHPHRVYTPPTIDPVWTWIDEVWQRFESPLGKIEVIKTKERLDQVAELFHNCAHAYAYNIQRKETLIVCLWGNTEKDVDEPIAMAEICVVKKKGVRTAEVLQLRGDHNKAIKKNDIIAEFNWIADQVGEPWGRLIEKELAEKLAKVGFDDVAKAM